MTTRSGLLRLSLVAATMFAVLPALADADDPDPPGDAAAPAPRPSPPPVFVHAVTPERLVNADREPGNWLMNHRTYDGQRFSPLTRVNTSNVKGMRLAYAVALGGSAANENIQATTLAEDGFLYTVDQWSILYKIDVRSGEAGRIVWRMDPGLEKPPTWSNRGAALWGDYVITVAGWPSRVIATHKNTGKIVWQTNMQDQPNVELTAAPLPIGDKIIVGASGGDRGVRDWIAGLDGATGKVVWKKFSIPAPGEPGSETWKDKNNAWQTGGGAMWVTGTYDPETHQTFWGTGNPVPMFDPTYRPGDNLFTNSAISWDPDTGKMNWYFQYLPGDGWDYDDIGTHVVIDAEINGQTRKFITHSSRNGHVYTLDRVSSQIHLAKPYTYVNWTKGIDQKTGKPVDYVPGADRQLYSGEAAATLEKNNRKQCPSLSGGNNFWPSSYSRKTKLLYIPATSGCNEIRIDPKLSNAQNTWKGGGWSQTERFESDLVAFDPIGGEIRKQAHFSYPDHSGALATAGGLVFTGYSDGTFAAWDDETLDLRWKINMGAGFTSPPMTFFAGDRQYVAIATGLSKIARGMLGKSPEVAEMRNSTVLYVFTVD